MSDNIKMAGLAIIRALSFEGDNVRVPKRVPSSQLIDKMKPIPEYGFLKSSPFPQRKTFNFESTSMFRESLIEETTSLLSKDVEQPQGFETSSKAFRRALNIFLAIMTVISMVIQVVSIPLYADAMSAPSAGSDAFIASFTATLWTPIILFVLHIAFNFRSHPKEVSSLLLSTFYYDIISIRTSQPLMIPRFTK